MEDKSQLSGGQGVLRKSASSGALKRSSSVEILTGITPNKSRRLPLNAINNSNSTSHLTPASTNKNNNAHRLTTANNCSGPLPTTVALSQQQKPPLPRSSSTEHPSAWSSEREGRMKPPLDNPISPFSRLNEISSEDVSESPSLGSLLDSTATESEKASTPINMGPLPKFRVKPSVSSPITLESGLNSTPIIGDKGHIFQVIPAVDNMTELSKPRPTAKVIPHEGDPFMQRRKRSAPTTTSGEPVAGIDRSNSVPEEPVWQKRLSQLFVPPSEDELAPDHEGEETSRLLPKSSPTLQPRQSPSPGSSRKQVKALNDLNKEDATRTKDNKERRTSDSSVKEKTENKINFEEVVLKKPEDKDGDRLSVLDELESGVERGSDEYRSSSSSSSSSGVSEEEEEEAGGDDYTSWDDTICSNRSAYFKMYYSQRGVIGNKSEDTKSKASRASSQNSLSSLIRERMAKPSLPAKKTRADIGLMVLVVVLFVIIVVGITLTSYFYNLHLLELTIFSCIKFYESPRILEIYDPNWIPVITAHLGSNLPAGFIPDDCTHYLHYLQKRNYSVTPENHEEEEEYEDIKCLDWANLARLQLRKLPSKGDVQCYGVWWFAATEEFTLRDCLKVDTEQRTWWGGGEMTDGGYPVNNANIGPTHMVTGRLGRDSWGQLLRRTWLSKHSSLLQLSEDFEGYVSVNHDNDGQICLESRPPPLLDSPPPTIKYTLCTASNLTTLSGYMHQEAVNIRVPVVEASGNYVTHTVDHSAASLHQPQKNVSATEHIEMENHVNKNYQENFTKDVTLRIQHRLEHPVWIPWMPPDRPDLTQASIIEYINSVLSQEYGSWGHVLLPATWQSRPGELKFDPERFPDPLGLVDTLENKGFRLALSIHPFVSVDTDAFDNGTREGLWVRQKDSLLPALAQYDDIHPSVITDFSNPRAKSWFSSQLEHLNSSYKIDRFHLQPADAHALPAFHEYHMPLPGPDSALIHFMAAVSSISPPLSTEGTITPPLPPTFLTMGSADGSWEGLETLVPRLLTLSMLGYPFVDVGTIGGIARAGHVPDRELYIRWMEAASFLPAFQISVLPHLYGKEMVSLASEYTRIRQDMVLPRLLSKIPDALQYGTPLITPLALFIPDDPEASGVYDEWVLGTDLLVAPVTKRGERSRNIYLPEGIWKDEIDGHLRRGGRWIKDYKVPLTKIPYFSLKTIADY